VDELQLTTSSGKLHKVLWDHDRNATAVAHNPTWKGRQLMPYGDDFNWLSLTLRFC
jgi:hypothetical protein